MTNDNCILSTMKFPENEILNLIYIIYYNILYKYGVI